MDNTNLVNTYFDFITNDERVTFEGICVGVYSKLSSSLADLNKACTQTLTSFVDIDIAATSGIIRWAEQASYDTKIFNMSFTVKDVFEKAHKVFSLFCDKLYSRGIITFNSNQELAFKAFLGYATLENSTNLFIDMNYDAVPDELKRLKSLSYKSTAVYSKDLLFSINRFWNRVDLNSFQEVDNERMCFAVQKITATKEELLKLQHYTIMRFDQDSFTKAMEIIHGYFEGAADRKLKDVKKDIGKMIYKEHRDRAAMFAYAFDVTMMGHSVSIQSQLNKK